MSGPAEPLAVEPLLTRNFVLLVVAHFLQALGFSSMLLLPLYLQHLEASRTQIGVLMAVAAVSGLVARPLIGWALDTLGRKPTLMVGTVTLAIGMGLVGAVESIGLVAYVERVVLGIGIAALFTGYFTFAADVIPASRRTEGLALFGISGLLPLLVNPFADQLGIEAPDLRWFLPLVGVGILLSLVPLAMLPEPRTPGGGSFRMREVVTALAARPLWPVWFATTIFSGMVALFMTFATVTAERRGVPRPATLWLTYAFGAVTVRALGARLPDRLGPANLVAPALGVYAVAAMLAASAATLNEFLVAGLLAGVGHGYCFPVLSGQTVTRIDARYRGSAFALFTALWGLSELVMSPLLGAVADRHGDGAMYWVAAVASIASLLVWLVMEHRLAPVDGVVLDGKA